MHYNNNNNNNFYYNAEKHSETDTRKNCRIYTGLNKNPHNWNLNFILIISIPPIYNPTDGGKQREKYEAH